jgi:hypothetical protein
MYCHGVLPIPPICQFQLEWQNRILSILPICHSAPNTGQGCTGKGDTKCHVELQEGEERVPDFYGSGAGRQEGQEKTYICPAQTA